MRKEDNFTRIWTRRIRDGARIIGPVKGTILLITQIPVLFLEILVCMLAERRLGAFPKVLPSKNAPAQVMIAVGINTTPYSVYHMGMYLRWRFGYEVLFVQTPPEGNIVPSRDIVHLNRVWLDEITGDKPLHAIGFSYGGFDIVWQALDLLRRGNRRVHRLHLINTPLRGSALATVIHVSGAREMDPGAESLTRTRATIHELRERGIRVDYNCSFLDLCARKSDTREERPRDSIVPGRFKRYILWPLMKLFGLRRLVPRLPDWWSYTLPQIGHKATLNPLVWEVIGRRIQRDLTEDESAPA